MRLPFRPATLRFGGTACLAAGCAAATLSSPAAAAAGHTGPSLQLPPMGLGLWKSKPGECHDAIKSALSAGYRLLDGAAAYANEKEVGAALAESFRDGLVSRSDVMIVSKLFNTHHCWKGDRTRPAAALAQTLSDLQVDYLDIYLMHWPMAFEQTELASIGGLRLPDGTPNPKLVMEVEFVETWREMVKLKRQGKARHLGVCNFTVQQLKELIEACPDDVPEVNQVELHPYLAQPELTEFCRTHGIRLMAYSPLGSADSYSGASFPPRGTGPFACPRGGAPLLQNELVAEVAARKRLTPAQVLLAWSVQQGFCCLPKSVKPHRIAENLASGSVELNSQDMEALAGLDCGWRYGIGYMPGFFDCPNAPWFKAAE